MRINNEAELVRFRVFQVNKPRHQIYLHKIDESITQISVLQAIEITATVETIRPRTSMWDFQQCSLGPRY